MQTESETRSTADETRSTQAQAERPAQQAGSSGASTPVGRNGVSRIAVGVDGFPEGRDAATLAAAISSATGAEVMLIAVHSAPLLPSMHVNWTTLRRETERTLRDVRHTLVPNGRTRTETDWSVPRALERVVRREHHDLLVMGSSREAPDGHVRIGKRTRQLLSGLECPLAVAPRGLHAREKFELRRVGVGYVDGPEAESALALAGWIAAAGGAELHVRAVVDDRLPIVLRFAVDGLADPQWNDVIAEEERRLHEQALQAAQATGASAKVDVLRGRPADALLALSSEVDLLVIGSRRWGPAARVLLGTTGEALMHDAACAVLAVPRTASVS